MPGNRARPVLRGPWCSNAPGLPDKRIGPYPRVRTEGGGRGVVSQARGVLLVETVRKTGLDQAISVVLAPWCKSRAVHDPGKVLLDAALAVALGGDCLAKAAESYSH
ncbi:hypothetical protein GCM10010358_77770 [Streptomyces minutiscleroticus]|uniref:Transposase DDE domain-containing protein n=1 Tax=Streptomyces minutiscleroticus TaxID=68238 RepID=A0A918P2H9_9ACTN|nr:hypothetical protein GCM10010358_77770 [Streptomyces minutiscleroticus]